MRTQRMLRDLLRRKSQLHQLKMSRRERQVFKISTVYDVLHQQICCFNGSLCFALSSVHWSTKLKQPGLKAWYLSKQRRISCWFFESDRWLYYQLCLSSNRTQSFFQELSTVICL